jgi:hypothetical protein
MYLTLRMASRTERRKSFFAPMIQQRFGHDAASRIAGAEEEHIEVTLGHRLSP